MNVRRFLMLALIGLAAAAGAAAAESWHVVLASGEKIPVSQIECMLMPQGANTYDIVLNHDNIVYPDVVRVTFEYCDSEAGVFGVSGGEKVLGPYHDTMVVKGAKTGTEIRICNSIGQCVVSTSLTGGDACNIDISGLPDGIYVLYTPNSRVKFVKR